MVNANLYVFYILKKEGYHHNCQREQQVPKSKRQEANKMKKLEAFLSSYYHLFA